MAARRLSFCTVVLLSASSALTAAELLPARPATAGLVVVAAAAPGLAFIDLVTERLPFALTGVLGFLVGSAFALDAMVSGEAGQLLRAVAATAVVAGIALAAGLLPGPGGESAVGGGDVVLAAVVAGALGWSGWLGVWAGFTMTFLLLPIGLLAARVWPGRGRTEGQRYVPLGPYLLAGWWGAIALAAVDLI